MPLKRVIKEVSEKEIRKHSEATELLLKTILLLKCKRQRQGRESEEGKMKPGRVMKGILVKGMTSQQVSSVLVESVISFLAMQV